MYWWIVLVIGILGDISVRRSPETDHRSQKGVEEIVCRER
jgi:hypothetical protein